MIQPITPKEISHGLTPGDAESLQTLLLRPPLGQGTQTYSPSTKLIAKLSGLVSLKGEDLLLQASSEVSVRASGKFMAMAHSSRIAVDWRC